MPEPVTLLDLWLPILVSSVVVFFASFIAHMVSPHHKGDFKPMTDEDGFLEKVRGCARAGYYAFPYCADWSDMKDPAKKARWEKGPHGYMSVWAKAPNMGQNLVLTFLVYLVVGIFVGYLTSLARPAGADYLAVFRVAGAAAVAAYCLGFLPHDIWMRRPARNTALDLVDGVIYGLLTAGVFAWLWPAAQVAAPG